VGGWERGALYVVVKGGREGRRCSLLEARATEPYVLVLDGGGVCVNLVTIYVILCRLFVGGDGSVARFMW